MSGFKEDATVTPLSYSYITLQRWLAVEPVAPQIDQGIEWFVFSGIDEFIYGKALQEIGAAEKLMPSFNDFLRCGWVCGLRCLE